MSHNLLEFEPGSTTTPSTMHTTTRCGDNVLADIDSATGTVVRTYVTPMLDSNVSMTIVGATPTTYYYNQDERQSVMNLTDSTGAVVQSYGYSAYGDKVDALTSGDVEQRYTYTGRELSDASGNYYFRYRWYGAGVGGFVSRDPWKYIDGMTMYNGWFAGRMSMDPKGLRLIILKPDDKSDFKLDKDEALAQTFKKLDCKCSCQCIHRFIGSKSTPYYYPGCSMDLTLQIKYKHDPSSPKWLEEFYVDGKLSEEKLKWYANRIGEYVAMREIVAAVKAKDAAALARAIVVHETAHLNYYRQWYESRIQALNNRNREMRNEFDGGQKGKAGKEACEAWLKINDECKIMKGDLFVFSNLQGDCVHNKNTPVDNSTVLPPYPMVLNRANIGWGCEKLRPPAQR